MGNFIKKFTSFEQLISTSLIKILYWAGIIGIVLFTLIGMFSGFALEFDAGVTILFTSLIWGAFAILFWRVMCEIYIVLFRMYDRLGNIQKAVGGGPVNEIDSVSDSDSDSDA